MSPSLRTPRATLETACIKFVDRTSRAVAGTVIGYDATGLIRPSLPAGDHRDWDRPRQFRRGLSIGREIEYGLIPLGSIGMTVLGLCLAIPDLSFRAVLLLLAALGFFGGFFIVPVSALIQHRPEERHKAASSVLQTGFRSWESPPRPASITLPLIPFT